MTFRDAISESVTKDCLPIARRSKGVKGVWVTVWEVTSATVYFQTEAMTLADLEARDWFVVRE